MFCKFSMGYAQTFLKTFVPFKKAYKRCSYCTVLQWVLKNMNKHANLRQALISSTVNRVSA